MRLSRTLRLAIPLAAMLTMVPLPASAHSVPCQDGPARLGSADRPHVDDPDGDGTQPWVTVLGGGGDIINAWVSGPSAWADRGSAEKFKATIRVESLTRYPYPGRHYFYFNDKDGAERWVRSESDSSTLGWLFSYGHLEGSTRVKDGDTTGTVNTSAGTITMDVPSTLLPPRPANGSALALEVTRIESFVRLPVNPGVVVGNLQLADTATPSCTAILYEAAPPV